MSQPLSHHALASLVGGQLVQGNPDGLVIGLNSLASARPGEVSFLGNSRYAAQARSTHATAILVAQDFAEVLEGKAIIKVDNPTLAFSAVVSHFRPAPPQVLPGIHPSAYVATSAKLDASTVHVGPLAIVEDGAVIGSGSVIHGGAYIGPNASLGEGCVIHAKVAVQHGSVLGNRVIIHSGSVIGSDGFGYEFVSGKHQKIDQAGIVEIGDDVEIGACTTIDRARFGKTYIGTGTKIDNLVQVGHNVTIGQHCILVAQTAIGGSSRLGNYVVCAGQVGIAGHLTIADQVTFLARAGVTKDHAEPGHYTGYPAKPLSEGRKLMIAPARVPELSKRIRELEQRLMELEKRSQS